MDEGLREFGKSVLGLRFKGSMWPFPRQRGSYLAGVGSQAAVPTEGPLQFRHVTNCLK